MAHRVGLIWRNRQIAKGSSQSVSRLTAGEVSDNLSGGWTSPFRSAGGAEAVAAPQDRCFGLLLGRLTYDLYAGYWPGITVHHLAEDLNNATKYVATRRPHSLAWGPAVYLGVEFLEDARRFKSQSGPGLIIWGSSTLTSVLLKQGLVDEVVLVVYPVLLGRLTGRKGHRISLQSER